MPKGMQRAKGACERWQPIQGGIRGDQILSPNLRVKRGYLGRFGPIFISGQKVRQAISIP